MNILIVDEMHPSIVPLLEAAGFAPEYRPNCSRDEAIAMLPQFEGLVIRSKFRLDASLLSHLPQLKVIARAGAGLDLIDLDYAQNAGIHLINAPEGNKAAVAEHAIGMLLALFNNLHKADREVRTLVWDREGNRGYEVEGKTVGIIGYGNMGQAFARCLSGFGCKVLAYDKYRNQYSDAYAIETSMTDIFAESDIVSLHIPLTPETRAMAGRSFFSSFAKPVYFINTARGEISPLEAIAEGIKSGKIAGACLDVLENEKLNTLTPFQKEQLNYLFASDKVLFSPHVAGWTHESYYKINEIIVRKLSLWHREANT